MSDWVILLNFGLVWCMLAASQTTLRTKVLCYAAAAGWGISTIVALT